MRLETRRRQLSILKHTVDVLLVAESQAESAILDELGSNVGEDGLIVTGEFELRLSDGYGEHYVLLKGSR